MVVLLAAPAFACHPITKCTASATEGVPGSTFEFSCLGGGGAGNLVKIEWIDSAQRVTQMGSALTDADSRFSKLLQVPADAAVGTVILVARQQGVDLQWGEPGRVSFQVMSPGPTVQQPTVTPTDSAPGGQEPVQVAQPAPAETAEPVSVGVGEAVAVPSADEAGSSSAAVKTPSAPVGTRRTEASASAAPAPVPAQDSPTPTPAPTPAAKSAVGDLWSGLSGGSSLESPATRTATGEQTASSMGLGLALVILGSVSIAGVGLTARRRRAYAGVPG